MQPFKILIVEDEPIIACHLQMLLEREGHEVLSASQATEATRLSAQLPPDFAILNFYQKGSADGMSLARLLRTKYLMKVLFITGARPTDISRSQDFYAGHEVLHKPFTRRQLRAALTESLP